MASFYIARDSIPELRLAVADWKESVGHLRVTFHLSTSPSEVDLETLELGLTEIVAARPEVRTLGALYACDQLLLAEARQGEGIVFEAPETN